MDRMLLRDKRKRGNIETGKQKFKQPVYYALPW